MYVWKKMNINLILLFTGCLLLINTINSSNNSTLPMFILATIQSYPLLIHHHLKRRSSAQLTATILNLTNDSIIVSTNKLRSLDSFQGYDNMFKDGSNLTRTQIKVIVTVVVIISFIMFIIAIFRFKNACRDQEKQNIKTEIIRRRASQFSEPSARRGSIGYYTRKYIRTPSIRFDEQLNISSSTKRSSVLTCDQLPKPIATVILSSTSIGSSAIPTTSTYRNYVKSPCDTSNNTNNQQATTTTTTIKPIVRKSCSAIGISRCDDQTPLLTSELASTIKNSSNRSTRKYSLNAFLPLTRSPESHPLSSSSTTTAANGSNTVGDGNQSRKSIDLKPRRRLSLSSALRRNSFAKQLATFHSTIDSTSTTKTTTPPLTSLPNHNNQSGTADSDSSDRTSLLETKTSSSKNQLRKKSSSITPIISSTSSSSSYRKDFMHKIERFRFIDDSASSTTTVTSPVESIDRINGHQPCSHLITSAIEQFDDYVRSRYHNNDDINSYIDRLNSDILTNGSYSDLNILNSTNDNTTIQQPQTIFKPVNNILSQTGIGDYHHIVRNSTPITIPSSHSKHTHPSDNSIARPTTIITNGHSRSMDFPSINNNHKYELHRPKTLLSNPGPSIYETSSSSIATLTSVRSSTSLEFDDDSKPSGVLVDDDFLPMSSPVDDHFWDMTIPNNHNKFPHHNKNGCFPNVGSSPDIEIKHFDPQQINPLSLSSFDQLLSETSCDEDDDNDHATLNQQKFSIHEYKLKELQKPIVIHRSIFNPSIHSIESTNHNTDLISIPIKKLSLDHQHDESLLERFASSNTESVQIPIRSPPLRTTTTTGDTILSSQPHPQTIYEEDDTQDSSTNDNVSDESADNGEIDLVHEFELSQKQEHTKTNNNLWSTNDRDIFILQEDDLLSALVTTQQIIRPPPPSIMKITPNKSLDIIDEQQITTNSLRPKVRFNLDPQYEREREWNKVNKLLGNSVEWTDEFEV